MKTVNILSEHNINLVEKYKELLAPDYIFIPINNNDNIKIDINDHVLKGTLVYQDDNISRYSTISGKYIKLGILNNKKYVIIKNDYKELSINRKTRNIDKITKDDFINYYSNNVVKRLLNRKIDTLYINSIDDDPYTFNKYMYLKNNLKDISNMISTLLRLFNIENVKIVIKNSYSKLLSNFKINVNYFKVDDIYPIGHKKLLEKYLIKDTNDVLIDLYDIIDMIYEVEKNRPVYEKYITINGDLVEEPCVINVKKYTYLSEILKNIKIKNKSYNVILNNSICGDILSLSDTICDDNTYAFIINKNKEIVSDKCSKCGLCYDVCPVGINPLVKSDKCIKCGLCNYVCPSKIDVVKEYQK